MDEDFRYPNAETQAKIDAFLKKWPRARFGPGHLVLEDLNIEDQHIEFCLNLARAVLNPEPPSPGMAVEGILHVHRWYEKHTTQEIQETIAFLEELLAIPENER